MNNFTIKMMVVMLCSCVTTAIKANSWQWHGFAAQGVIYVPQNNFVDNKKEFSTKLTELGLNTSVNIQPNLRFATQLVYLDGGNRYQQGARVDYLLLDWNFLNKNNWQADLYLGRFKNIHWLYSSVRNVPFARPSIILPQSIYFDGFRDIASGADGAALKLSYSDDNYGDVDVNLTYGTSPLSRKQSQIILSKFALGSAKQDFDVQASVYWRPTMSAWRFGVSLLNSDFNYNRSHKLTSDIFYNGQFSFKMYTANMLYEGKKWEFSSEMMQERFITRGFYQQHIIQDKIGQAIYAQVRYQVNYNLKLLARYEKYYNDKNDKNGRQLAVSSGGAIPHYFAFQNDLVLGLSFDLSNNSKIRLEQHWVNGTARLNPIVLPNALINNHQYWQISAVQLMIWF